MVTEMTDSNTARNWFDENWFNSGIDKIDNVKWTFVAMNLSRKIVLNPRYPDTILYIEERMSMLPKLVASFIAIDSLAVASTANFSSAIEAFEYLIRFNNGSETVGLHRDEKLIISWKTHMGRIQQRLRFRSDYTTWDKHARVLEKLILIALAESQAVIEAHATPDNELPKEVMQGIYLRVEQLQVWRREHLEPVRERLEYKKWRAEEEKLKALEKEKAIAGAREVQTTRLRNNHLRPSPSPKPEIPLELRPHSRDSPTAPHTRSAKFKDNLTIWILHLSIYLSCTIIQSFSVSQPSSSPDQLSTSTILNTLQTTLTQILSVIMTYILAIRSTNSKANSLGKRHKIWFLLAGVLPVLSLAVLKWSQGTSALLSFVGTAVTGCLQVVLAVDMQSSKVLPS